MRRPADELLGDVAAPRGKLILYGINGGNDAAFPACAVFKKHLQFYRHCALDFTRQPEIGLLRNDEAVQRALPAINQMTADQLLKPSIDRVFDFAQYRDMASKPGLVARNEGDIGKALEKPAQLIEAEYQFPYLAHAAMEPLDCVVFLKEDGCQIWNGEQWQTGDQMSVAQLLGIPPEQVSITQLYASGSFGRRANLHSDYVLEAVAIAKAAREQGVKVPIKMVWTREDDTRAG